MEDAQMSEEEMTALMAGGALVLVVNSDGELVPDPTESTLDFLRTVLLEEDYEACGAFIEQFLERELRNGGQFALRQAVRALFNMALAKNSPTLLKMALCSHEQVSSLLEFGDMLCTAAAAHLSAQLRVPRAYDSAMLHTLYTNADHESQKVIQGMAQKAFGQWGGVDEVHSTENGFITAPLGYLALIVGGPEVDHVLQQLQRNSRMPQSLLLVARFHEYLLKRPGFDVTITTTINPYVPPLHTPPEFAAPQPSPQPATLHEESVIADNVSPLDETEERVRFPIAFPRGRALVSGVSTRSKDTHVTRNKMRVHNSHWRWMNA